MIESLTKEKSCKMRMVIALNGTDEHLFLFNLNNMILKR
jgi:hypothetical protein